MEKCFLCNKEIILLKTFKCKFCPLYFCSINCLMTHISTHNNPKNEEAKNLMSYAKKKHSRQISKKYTFIIPGIFHEKENFSEKYSLNYFSKKIDGFLPIELGFGAYGRVYLVNHNETKKEFALKVIEKKKILNMYGNCDIIHNEIKIHSKIEHPNIIRLYNVNETETEINIIMEYAKKGNLYQLISQNKTGFKENKAFHYFIQVVNAVYFLHENQIIHRDIKPENILIAENDIIKLCDFGWAKQLTIKNRSSFCGTVEYMAPEIIGNENYDFSVDIWSLGILLYELIMGHSPFKDKTNKNTIVKIKLHELKFDRKISDDCKDLINKLLEVNKEKRFNIKDIFTHNFIKKNENLLNDITLYKYFASNEIQKYEKNNNTYIINNINMNSNESQNGDPFKNDYSKSISSSKYKRFFSNNYIINNSGTPKKLNKIRKYNFGSTSNKKSKYNTKFEEIRETLIIEVEKSKKKMDFLNI